MNKIALGILIGVVVLGVSLSWAIAQGRPARGDNKAQAPEIERGVFVDYGYDSPPWYPQDCDEDEYETDKYLWAPKIHWATTTPPITVYTGSQPISGTFDAIETGFETWDATTSFPLYGTTTESTSTWPGVDQDYQNTVGWASIDGSGGIIGVTYYWYERDSKEMIEFDIILDKDDPWATDGTSTAFDVQNVATHEAGHTLVLGDIRSPKSCGLTMHAYTWKGDTIKRDLAQGDILGVQAIYGK